MCANNAIISDYQSKDLIAVRWHKQTSSLPFTCNFHSYNCLLRNVFFSLPFFTNPNVQHKWWAQMVLIYLIKKQNIWTMHYWMVIQRCDEHYNVTLMLLQLWLPMLPLSSTHRLWMKIRSRDWGQWKHTYVHRVLQYASQNYMAHKVHIKRVLYVPQFNALLTHIK